MSPLAQEIIVEVERVFGSVLGDKDSLPEQLYWDLVYYEFHESKEVVGKVLVDCVRKLSAGRVVWGLDGVVQYLRGLGDSMTVGPVHGLPKCATRTEAAVIVRWLRFVGELRGDDIGLQESLGPCLARWELIAGGGYSYLQER